MVSDHTEEALAIGFELFRSDTGEPAQFAERAGARAGHLAQRRIVEDDIGRHLRFLGQFLLNPSEAAVVATVAARGQTVASLFETLRPGRQAGTAAEFDRARAVVVTLCEVVVTGAIQHARALAAQEEHEQAMQAHLTRWQQACWSWDSDGRQNALTP